MSEMGQRILSSLKDAVAGNWSRVTMDGQTWERVDGIKKASNAGSWALGVDKKGGFRIRKIVWGRMLARAEKRNGEKIRKATIYVEMKK